MFVFFRTRNSAATAHLTFLIPVEKSAAWLNVLKYVGSFLKLQLITVVVFLQNI